MVAESWLYHGVWCRECRRRGELEAADMDTLVANPQLNVRIGSEYEWVVGARHGSFTLNSGMYGRRDAARLGARTGPDVAAHLGSSRRRFTASSRAHTGGSSQSSASRPKLRRPGLSRSPVHARSPTRSSDESGEQARMPASRLSDRKNAAKGGTMRFVEHEQRISPD